MPCAIKEHNGLPFVVRKMGKWKNWEWGGKTEG